MSLSPPSQVGNAPVGALSTRGGGGGGDRTSSTFLGDTANAMYRFVDPWEVGKRTVEGEE